ncbi:amino acid transporter [Zooshikella marina]|uniref:Amino acid transporter n=1 Tax=Zooshikella ganghwensis TaxID=202772 RepID=A0A4P9VPM4_9GAMM|nr:LysE/ArgO family amino acid transporter [Zooshikella ganghwensis]MBU2709089.1 amino acid transporter [Zooshikella ganghwensis]RDH43992.1 amino acid transporter [Zooshikella ganghwensis]
MWFPFSQGFAIGLGMIIPIGAQNTFVLNHALKRHYPFSVALVCSLCDAVLISVGVAGVGSLLSQHTGIILLAKYVGAAFLLCYAGFALLKAWRNQYESTGVSEKNTSSSVVKVILATLIITLVNPQVYLDTLVFLGSLGAQYADDGRLAFTSGAVAASFVWFFSLTYGASFLATKLHQPKYQRGIDVVTGCIMFWFAGYLVL